MVLVVSDIYYDTTIVYTLIYMSKIEMGFNILMGPDYKMEKKVDCLMLTIAKGMDDDHIKRVLRAAKNAYDGARAVICVSGWEADRRHESEIPAAKKLVLRAIRAGLLGLTWANMAETKNLVSIAIGTPVDPRTIKRGSNVIETDLSGGEPTVSLIYNVGQARELLIESIEAYKRL